MYFLNIVMLADIYLLYNLTGVKYKYLFTKTKKSYYS